MRLKFDPGSDASGYKGAAIVSLKRELKVANSVGMDFKQKRRAVQSDARHKTSARSPSARYQENMS